MWVKVRLATQFARLTIPFYSGSHQLLFNEAISLSTIVWSRFRSGKFDFDPSRTIDTLRCISNHPEFKSKSLDSDSHHSLRVLEDMIAATIFASSAEDFYRRSKTFAENAVAVEDDRMASELFHEAEKFKSPSHDAAWRCISSAYKFASLQHEFDKILSDKYW